MIPAEMPLRLYHQGLPHRNLGPPQSTWEADKNAAVIALADRVQQLENDIRQQQQQEGELQQQQQQDREPEPQALPVEPYLAATDRLPLPRNALGSAARVVDMAALYGVHVGGPPPVPVTYYTPRGPSPTQTRAAQPALGRLMTAQETRSQTRAFAASVVASAASTVPSIMMRRMPNENAQPCRSEEGDVRRTDGGSRCVTSSVGVSAPLGHARTAAIAAASAHVATLQEAAPLQAAGPYPMVAAALAVGAPGTGSSTWEQGKMRALLSLEQQRDALRAQVRGKQCLRKPASLFDARHPAASTQPLPPKASSFAFALVCVRAVSRPLSPCCSWVCAPLSVAAGGVPRAGEAQPARGG